MVPIWLHQASGVQIALEAFESITNLGVALQITYPLLSFSQLQGVPHALPVGIPAPSMVFSLSAPSLSDETNKTSGLAAPRPQVFATSRQVRRHEAVRGFIPPHRHYQGLWPSEHASKVIRNRFPIRDTYAVTYFSWVPS